jgi:hypothetical protein
MGPWTSQTVAVVAGAQHHDEVHASEHRDEDLDEILQNLDIPIEGDSPPERSD